MADPKPFTLKGNPVTYTQAFIEFYNWKNHEQVHEIHEIIEFEKMHASNAKNPYILSVHRIIKISSVPHSIYIVFRDQDEFVFSVNNNINWNQFNSL